MSIVRPVPPLIFGKVDSGMHNSFCPHRDRCLFAGFWIAGLLFGVLAAVKADLSVISLMRLGAFRRVSIVLLLCWYAFPLWITAWSVKIQNIGILFLWVFCRCFCFSFLSWMEVRAFGSAAWLAVPFSRCCDCLTLLIFCWFAFRGLNGKTSGKQDFWISLLLTCVAVIADYFTVSLYLASL